MMAAVPLQRIESLELDAEPGAWSTAYCFQIAQGAENELDRTLLLPLASVREAVEKLNIGAVLAPAGLCVVFSESQQGHFVLYRRDCQSAALARFWKNAEVGVAARLTATKVIVAERMFILPLMAKFYRLLEFSAQVLFFCLMTWVVSPWLLAVLFVALWYLPAVRQTGGFGKPLGNPSLNFFVDGFSFLNIHPEFNLRQDIVSPGRAYGIAMLRVVLLIFLIPLLIPALSPLPDEVLNVIANMETLNKLSWLHKRDEVGDFDMYAEQLWKVVAIVIFTFTLMWLIVVIPMLLMKTCLEYMSSGAALGDAIKMLALEIQYATTKGAEGCRDELCHLREKHPRLQLTTIGSTVGPAWAVVLHIVIDVFNIVSFINADDTGRASLLGFVVIVTLCYANNLTTDGLFSICRETKLSFSRGVVTDDWLSFVRADKGIQAIPSLIIILSGMPFKATNMMATMGGMGSIAINIILVVPFLYESFDLGWDADCALAENVPATEVPAGDLAVQISQSR